jgi:hypothetical protein
MEGGRGMCLRTRIFKVDNPACGKHENIYAEVYINLSICDIVQP